MVFLLLPVLEALLALVGLEMLPVSGEAGKFSSNTLIEVWEAEVLVLLDDLEWNQNYCNVIQNFYFSRDPLINCKDAIIPQLLKEIKKDILLRVLIMSFKRWPLIVSGNQFKKKKMINISFEISRKIVLQIYFYLKHVSTR